MSQTRDDRLKAEHQALTELQEASSILSFDSFGEPPNRYKLTFRGKGVRRSQKSGEDVELLEVHHAEIRLPFGYPERAPDVRWLTPLFHPNVSFSGFINLEDIGLTWEKQLTLDIVCERLWDVVRAAVVDYDRATNYAANTWYENECTLVLPVDHRPLRDANAPASSNIIHYERRDGKRVEMPRAVQAEVLFIGEDTPLPTIPPASPDALPPRRVPPRLRDGEDIFFIGDD